MALWRLRFSIGVVVLGLLAAGGEAAVKAGPRTCRTITTLSRSFSAESRSLAKTIKPRSSYPATLAEVKQYLLAQKRLTDLATAGDALKRLAAACNRGGGQMDVDSARLVAAVALDRLKRHQAALALLEKIRTRGHPLADYVTWLTARQELALNRPGRALSGLLPLGTRLRRSVHPLSMKLDRDLARAAARTGRHALAARVLRDLAAREKRPWMRARIDLARSEILLRAGRRGEARAALLAVYARAPLWRAGRRARGLLRAKFSITRRRLLDALGPADRVAYVYALTRSRNRRVRRRAWNHWAGIIAQPHWDARTKWIYDYLRARRLYRRGRFKAASALFQKLDKRAADPEEKALCLAWAFRSAVHLGDGSGRGLLKTMLRRRCDRPACVSALLYLAKSHARAGALANAHRAYLLAGRLAPDHDRGHRALWYGAKMWLKAGRRTRAAKVFLKLADLAGHSRFRSGALFHAGRIYARLGRRKLARACFSQAAAEFPADYYGQEAARRVSRIAARGPAALKRAAARCPVKFLPPPVFSGHSPPQLKADPGWRRYRLLCRLDLADLARLEMKDLLKRHPGQRGLAYHLMKSYHRQRRHRRAFFVLVKNLNEFKFGRGKNLPADFNAIIYPRRYQAAIVSIARKYDLNPYFLMGVGLSESRFVPLATSPVGARGLFQIMPFLGRRLARRLGLTRFYTAMLYVDRLNLEMAAFHLRELHQIFGGKQHLMAAAYNAGQAAVKRWLARLGTSERVKFIEGIGYLETRIFVKNVLQAKRVYAARGPRRLAGRPEKSPRERRRPAAAERNWVFF
jgi:tetratricopeptide (TPR) repeat protein